MKNKNAVYVGINPASGHKEFGFAVLDRGLNLLDLSWAEMDEVSQVLERYEFACVAVTAPERVNQGLVKQKITADYSKAIHALRGTDIRLAEYELRQRGISVTGTPSTERFCPSWMRAGFRLYERLSQLGYQTFGTGNNAPRQFFETHPYACFCVLLQGLPLSKTTLEGRLQRQLLLNDRRVQIVDGMDFFEEITRFKLMHGILPEDVLYTPEELDVLVAAYTASQVADQFSKLISLGDPAEGRILLPVDELLEKYA